MILSEGIYFCIVSIVNAYLSLFLYSFGYSATEIGFLFGLFNISAILVPFFLLPLISKRNRYSLWLVMLGLVMLLSSWMLFSLKGFVFTAAMMIVFGGAYQCVIPVSDSLINTVLGEKQEQYGIIRSAGTLGFVVMSLVLQKAVDMESITRREMKIWLCSACFLFVLSLLVRELFIRLKMNTCKEMPVFCENKKEDGKKSESLMEVLKGFGREFYIMLAVILLEFLGMVPPNMYVSLYAQEELGVNASGLLWAAGALAEFPFMFLSVFFIRKFRAKPLIFICTAFVIVRLLFYVLVPNLAGCILGQLLNSLTYGLFFPCCVSFCTEKSRGNSRALMVSMTLLSAVYGLAKVIGSPIGGLIIDGSGYRTLFVAFTVFPVLALLLYFPSRRH